MRKRLIPLIMVLCLLVCGCNKDKTPEASTNAPTTAPSTQAPTAPATSPEESVPEQTQPETTAPTVPETVPPTVPETVPPTVPPTEPPAPAYRHPLTGQVLSAPFTGRPVAVSIGNTSAALPQHGIGSADVLVEVESEGDVTRFLAVITDLQNVEAIGPIRSARTFLNNMAAAFNAPIAHCGGSVRGIRGYYDLNSGKIPNWNHFDEFTYGAKYFYRDYDRYNYQDYAWEHCLFTSGSNMAKALTDVGYQTSSPWDLGFTFNENPGITGSAAAEITVTFRAGRTSKLLYDDVSGLYSLRQNGKNIIDGNTGEAVSFRNVVVLKADQTRASEGNYVRSYYDLIGEGEGHLAVDGKIVDICWSRSAVDQPFVYTYPDGSAVELGWVRPTLRWFT